MPKEKHRDYLGNTLKISRFLASKYAPGALSKTPRRGKKASKVKFAELPSDVTKLTIAKGDIKRKLHERLDFDDKSAYIGVLLHFEEMPMALIKHVITFNKDQKIPNIIPQEPYPSSSELAAYQNRKVDSSYLRWRHSDIAKFLEGNTRVNPEKLFKDIVSVYKRYCYFESEDTYYLLALWIMGTYLFPLFPAYPLILLNGPKGSGKSRTSIVSSCMAFNAQSLTDPNNATIFRLADKQRASLFFDDAEWLVGRRMTRLLSTLKSSYKKTAKVPRVGQNIDGSIDEYEIYSPKMFNNIYGIEDVMGSRTITITQKVAPKSAKLNKHDPDENDSQWADIRNRLYLFTFNHWRDIKKLLPEQTKLPLRDRAYELYAGLLSIAQILDIVSKRPVLHKRIFDVAMRDVEERKSEYLKTNPEALAIQTLLTLVLTDGWYSSSQIASEIKTASDSPREITPVWTGKVLKSLGFGKRSGERRRPREAIGRKRLRPTECYIRRSDVIKLAKSHDIAET